MSVRRLLVAAFGLALAAAPAHAQLKGVRFEIATVGDTTIGFRAGTEHWLKAGLRGIAVDPRKRDVLVARLRISKVDRSGNVTAVVTGQTTAVTTEHVVLMQEVSAPWFRRRTFWSGLVMGAALGVAAGTQF